MCLTLYTFTIAHYCDLPLSIAKKLHILYSHLQCGTVWWWWKSYLQFCGLWGGIISVCWWHLVAKHVLGLPRWLQPPAAPDHVVSLVMQLTLPCSECTSLQIQQGRKMLSPSQVFTRSIIIGPFVGIIVTNLLTCDWTCLYIIYVFKWIAFGSPRK